MEENLQKETQAERLVKNLAEKKMRIAAAEAGTGGMFSQSLSAVPGAAAVFRCGVAVFDQDGMNRLAGVKKSVCRRYGLDSKEAAIAMADGIRRLDKAGAGIGVSAADNGRLHTAVCLKSGAKTWMAVLTVEPFPYEELSHQRQRAVDGVLSLLNGYFDQDPASLAVYSPIKLYRRLCGTPLPVKILQFFLPWPGDRAGDVAVKLLLIAAIVTGAWAGVQLSQDTASNIQSAQVIERAVEAMETPPTPEQVSSLPDGYLEKFAAAYEINHDLAGWLTIPNTNMNLPVVQCEDNDFYLNHSFEGTFDTIGTPFMDFRNEITPELNTNTLIYGHNWESGAMFHSLLLYRDLEFYKTSPVITFDTVYEESQWKVISCFEATTDSSVGEVFNYFNFVRTKNEERIQWYIDEITARSFFLTTVDVNTSDKFLTIQTCANDRYNTKVCIVARKVRPGESAEVDVENAVVNENRVKPSRY